MRSVLIIIGILVSVLLLFDPPELFNIIVDTITMILIGIGIVMYSLIYVDHLRKTKDENNN